MSLLRLLLTFAVTFPALAQHYDSSKDLFDDTRLHQVHLEISADDWALLRQNYLDNTYYQASVSLGDTQLANVGIRSRGRGSRSPDKPNFAIKANKYVKGQKFAGLETFQLKANNQDSSMLHEILTFKLFRKMGLPAPREAPARVYLNGEYFGLYMLVENEDEDFLDRNFGESAGDLFEWKPNEVYNFEDRGTDPQAYATFLDPQTNEDNPDLQKFVDMVQAINHTSDANFASAVSQYLDLKTYLTHLATENAVAEFDGIWGDTYGTNNLDLYRFAGQDLFTLITWDKDFAFLQTDRDPFSGSQRNVLARRLLAIPEYHAYYAAQLQKAISLLGGSSGWADLEATRLYSLIRDSATEDPHKHCALQQGGVAPCGATDFERGVQSLHAFLAQRQPFVIKLLASLGYSSSAAGPNLHSVSFEPFEFDTALVPGSLAEVRGTGFTPLDTPAPASGALPRTSGRSFVAVDGVRAPILSMTPDRAVIQIPWDIPVGTTPIAVAASGMSNTLQAQVVPSAPAILAVTHADGQPVTPASPAREGELVVVYAVGLGQVDRNLAPGVTPTAAKLPNLLITPEVRLGDEEPEVLFAGLAPGFIGLYQINLRIPDYDVPSGTLNLTVEANNQEAEVTLSIAETP